MEPHHQIHTSACESASQYLQNACNLLFSQHVCAFSYPFTLFVVECVQTTRDVVSELLFLMGRNLEEASRKMISNRNPPSWHTSAGPWGDLFIFSKLSIGKTNQLCNEWMSTLIISFYLNSSNWYLVIHDSCGVLIRHPIFRSTLVVCLFENTLYQMKLLLLFQHWSVVGNETLASNSCFCCLWSELNSMCECLGVWDNGRHRGSTHQ